MRDDRIDVEEVAAALEAIVFAAGEPVGRRDLKRLLLEEGWTGDETRLFDDLFEEAVEVLRGRWAEGASRGFVLNDVSAGLTFRTHPRFARLIQRMRSTRPVRLSKPALETLAIVAYRQPVTRPEVEEIRGVDCSATLRLLLDRKLIRIAGKKEEPGRPLLYATTKEFLSFFNLDNLAQLPSLREYDELNEESAREVEALEESLGLAEVAERGRELAASDDGAVGALEEAMSTLRRAEARTRAVFGGAEENDAGEGEPSQEEEGPDGG